MSQGARDLRTFIIGMLVMLATIWGGLYLGTMIPEGRTWVGLGLLGTGTITFICGMLCAMEGAANLNTHGWRS